MDTRIDNLNGILLRDVRWSVTTAGPSPHNNERTELFLLGCSKALNGNPCKGCFNQTTWDPSKAEWSHDPELMANHILEHAPNKYITIGGGEPFDQIHNLIKLCRILKTYGFHIMVYTHHELNKLIHHNLVFTDEVNKASIFRGRIKELMNYVDMIVDGPFIQEECLYNFESGDGLTSSVGSGNQIVWRVDHQFKSICGSKMSNIKSLQIKEHNSVPHLTFNFKDLNQKLEYIKL